jgi:hypothetical protein
LIDIAGHLSATSDRAALRWSVLGFTASKEPGGLVCAKDELVGEAYDGHKEEFYNMGALNEVIHGGESAKWDCTGDGTSDAFENIFTYVTDGA